MKRRDFMRSIAAGAAGAAASGGRISHAAGGKRPNFLFLFTDDQTFRSIGSLNNPAVRTPNIDRLVRRGVTFTHCFNQGSWTGAVCVASRAMLNTGRFIYHAQNDIQNPAVPLWGETLGANGYQTFMTGKWHNGDATLQRSFKHVGPHGGGMYHSTPYDGSAYHRPAPGNEWSPYDKSQKGHWLELDDGSIVHSSERWADASVDFLENTASQSDDPFFMYVAFHAPHDPRQAPKRFVDMYPLDKIEIPPNYMPEHPFDQGDHKLRDEILAPFPRSEHAVKVHLQEYYAIISHADEQIGRILDALEASGELENTVIFFSADHGLAVGQHGLLGKQNQYDHSIRMPLIVCGPGIEAGAMNDELVYLHSLYATSCDMAGIPVPDTVEFPSLAPLLDGGTASLHGAIYGSYRDFQRMIRTRRYKLIHYPHLHKTQLFDVELDPWELNDISDAPGRQDLVRTLYGQLKRLQKDVGDDLALAPL